MNRLVIFGLGDIARLAHFYFSKDSDYEVAGFTVDEKYLSVGEFCGLPTVAFERVTERFPPSDHAMFVAVSYAQMNRLRAGKCAEGEHKGYRLASYVSSRARVLTEEVHGDNCFILEDAVLQPFVRIGRNVTVWSGAHIGHDSTIEDHCFIAPRVAISGNVRIGSYCFIGVNATIRNSVTVASASLIGAGAVILGDTEEGAVYAAPRARRLGQSSSEIHP